MTGLAFRSILIPLRLLLTVAVTLVFVAGTTQVVFQQAMGLDGVYWLIPIATAPLAVGLTIDYDVFLISRVHETRLKGRSTSSREEEKRGREDEKRREEPCSTNCGRARCTVCGVRCCVLCCAVCGVRCAVLCAVRCVLYTVCCMMICILKHV
jgi:hypothetical protein